MSKNNKNRRIIFVHGKNTKPTPTVHRELLLKSLRAGFAKTEYSDDIVSFDDDSFLLCAWSDLLYPDYEEPQILQSAVERLVQQSQEPRKWSGASSLAICLRRYLYFLVDYFPALLKLLPVRHLDSMLEGTRAYLENDNGKAVDIRARLSSLMKSVLLNDEQEILIIAHSLGSVIAYDLLASQPQWMDTRSVQLLTLGSPLGLRYIQARIFGSMKVYPSAVSHWDNVSAYGDMVSLDTTLQDDFVKMKELGVLERINDIVGIKTRYKDVNGMNPHKSYGYLAHPTVAGLVAAWYLDCEVEVNEQ